MKLKYGRCGHLTKSVRPMYGVLPVVKTSKHRKISNLVEQIRTGTIFFLVNEPIQWFEIYLAPCRFSLNTGKIRFPVRCSSWHTGTRSIINKTCV